jgi:DNA-binding protein HU-beta
MTKNEFVDQVADRAKLSKKDAAAAVDAFIESITEALKKGDSVSFTGFGKFSTSKRAARVGVNPRSPGEKVNIPAATVPKFTAGSALKSAVKGS